MNAAAWFLLIGMSLLCAGIGYSLGFRKGVKKTMRLSGFTVKGYARKSPDADNYNMNFPNDFPYASNPKKTLVYEDGKPVLK